MFKKILGTLSIALALGVSTLAITPGVTAVNQVTPNTLNIPGPNPTSVVFMDTAPAGSYSYVFQNIKKSYTVITCDIKGLTASGAVLTSYTSADAANNNPYTTPALSFTSAPISASSNISADGQYTFYVAGTTYLDLNVTTTGVSNGTITCNPSLTAQPPQAIDTNGYRYVDIGAQTGPITVNTPAPYPNYLTSGFGGFAPVGPSAEPSSAPVNGQYQAVIDNAGNLNAKVQGATANGIGSPAPNPVLTSCWSQASGGNSTNQATHQNVHLNCDLGGTLFVRHGTPNTLECDVTLSSNAVTLCQSQTNSGFTAYITDIDVIGGSTETAGTFQIYYGTGSNCATGKTALGPAFNIAAGAVNFMRSFTMPMVTSPATQTCVALLNATTTNVTVELKGYIAP